MSRGYARSRARTEAIQAQLEPLGPDERPLGLKLAVALALLIAVANLVGAAAGAGGESPAVGVVFALLMGALAVGHVGSAATSWSLLFQALLALTIIVSTLSLAFAGNVLAAVVAVVADRRLRAGVLAADPRDGAPAGAAASDARSRRSPSLAAGFAAGGVNTIVGSGSLITFPTLLAVGYPRVVANVSNTVGLVPGGDQRRDRLPARAARASGGGRCILAIGTTAGALLGGILLLELPESVFDAVVPILILLACVLMAIKRTPAAARRRRAHRRAARPPRSRPASTAATSARRRGSS